MKTILCFGDSNTGGCIPLAAMEPPRRYGPAPQALLVCPAPVGRLELFAEEFAGAGREVPRPRTTVREGRRLLA